MGNQPLPTIDFVDFIAEHTKDFTGREWILQEIDHWLDPEGAARYFLLTGEPGCGKSSVRLHERAEATGGNQ